MSTSLPEPSVRVVGRSASRPGVNRSARLRRVALVAFVVVVVDQVSKVIVRAGLEVGETWPEGVELLHLSHVENSGAAFGILQGAGTFLVAASSLAIVAIVLFVAWGAPASRLYTGALALVLGGAVGNLIDRVARGSVTDFIDPTHYPAFNLADSAIVIGVGTLVLLSTFAPNDSRTTQRETPSDPPGMVDTPFSTANATADLAEDGTNDRDS